MKYAKATTGFSSVRESQVEDYFKKQVEALGAEVRKLKWIGRRNAADRFVAFNGVWLVELKRPTTDERIGQKRERLRLEAQGVRCRVCHTLEEVDQFVDELCQSVSKT